MYQVRPAGVDDGEKIIEFQLKMAKESEDMDLDREALSRGVMAVFDDSSKGRYFVATADGEVVGSMMITTEWSDWRNMWVYWMQSVYVLPLHRGKGLFRKMYGYIKEIVKKNREVAGLRLYVDVSNANAIGVYRSVGMDGEHYKVFEWMGEEG